MSRVPSRPARRVASTPAVAGFRQSALAVAAAFALHAGAHAQSVPAGAVHGTAAYQRDGANLLVTTTNGAGHRSVLNWQSFHVPAGSRTWFQQPDAASTSINRVTGGVRSDIFGSLGSNGKLVLVNPSGIAIGANAMVDTAGFTASAMGLSEADAIAGRLLFQGGAGELRVGEGAQVLARGGDVVLVGSRVQVERNAVVQASGATILAAGEKVEVTGRGLEGIRLEVNAGNEAVNLGTLRGDAVAIFAGTLKHSGLVQAQAATAEGGKVVLKATADALVDGTVRASGKRGGSIDVLGERVGLLAGSTVDASGLFGGGSIRIGGDYQGRNAAVPNAKAVFVDASAKIRADASLAGNGGRVIVWSDEVTRMRGAISARGGNLAGNGGFVEVSSKGHLAYTGFTDLSAPRGRVGDLLLDPQDIVIFHTGDTAYTHDAIALANNSGGTDFTYTGGPSYMADGIINSQLRTSNLTITTSHDSSRYASPISPDTGTGGQITINADVDINWTTPNRLEFLADKGIAMLGGWISGDNAGASLVMTAKNGSIVLNPSATVQVGNGITFSATGDIQFGSLRAGYVSTGSGSGRSAGPVVLNAGGNVSGNAIYAYGDYLAGGDGGDGGDVTVTAGGSIAVGTIAAQGGNAYERPVFTMPPVPPGKGGRGGKVTLKANGGGVTVSDITAYGGDSAGGSLPSGAAGAAGNIEVVAKGDVAIDYMKVSGALGLTGSAAGTVSVTADGSFTFDEIQAVGGRSYDPVASGKGGTVLVDVKGDIVMTPRAGGDAINADGGYGERGAGGQGGSITLKAGGTVRALPVISCDCASPPTTGGVAWVSASGGQGNGSPTGGTDGGAGGTIRVETGAPLVIDSSMILAAGGGEGGDVYSGGTGLAGKGGAGGTLTVQSKGTVTLRDALLSAGGGGGGVGADGVTRAADGALGTFTASGTAVEVVNSFLLDGHWINNSVVNLRDAAIVAGSGIFRNASDVNLYGTSFLGMAAVENGGRFRAFGSRVGATLTRNSGLVEINAGSTLDAAQFTDNSGMLVVNGTLNLGSSAGAPPPVPTPSPPPLPPLGVAAAALGSGAVFTNQASGTIAGSGTLNVDGGTGTVDNFGTLAPGGAGTVGTLNVNGNLTMQSGSVYAADLKDTTVHDQVVVAGAARTGGTVQVNLLSGASYAAGDSVAVLKSNGLDATSLPAVNKPEFTAKAAGNDLLLVAAGTVTPPPPPTGAVEQQAQQQANNQVTTFLTLFEQLQRQEPRRIGKDDIVVTDTACTR
ncbi:filamentous hemagglutinin N-terminal domain-containing protein [Ramlibacter sp. USB13]|uniref:Filamentous hemagglutinin N-terminal domain-containing protein n=1 Tax=Ramlibacter cellulosilyticus TaxID=2764187 RepID=A0A923MP03_9BURK|nr:filamentous hemagglutinin N-terminal domain-containing protein [Ramlibacter cellulosilyticus]MBC5782855.1 filamentous hemagglutinin N-terminal domain-containing protein [Ramlibacter cellulosilyticus]